MQSLKLIHIIRVAFFFYLLDRTCKTNYRCPCNLSGLKQLVFWSNYGQPGPSGISWGRFQFRILQLRYKPKLPSPIHWILVKWLTSIFWKKNLYISWYLFTWPWFLHLTLFVRSCEAPSWSPLGVSSTGPNPVPTSRIPRDTLTWKDRWMAWDLQKICCQYMDVKQP